MSDVEDIPSKGKSPIESASNKLREAIQKEAQKKVDEQLKKVVDARKIYRNELQVLRDLQASVDEEKLDLSQMLKELV